MPDEPHNVVRLPLPDHLDPPSTAHALGRAVRGHFYSLFNNRTALGVTFRKFLASVDNKTSETENRVFDRHEAVKMIKKAAADANDSLTDTAKDGKVYQCLVAAMRTHPQLRLRNRRAEYERLTRQQAAE